MAYIAFIFAILVLIRRLGNWSSDTRQALLVILALLPSIGVALSLWGGSEERRARVSVSFLGYSIPWSSLRSCTQPPDPFTKTGVWIGGGNMRQGGIALDTVALPGYRSHLVELCRVESSRVLSLQARVASEGMEFKSSPGKAALKSSDEVHTQRVVLRSLASQEGVDDSPDICLTLPGGTTVTKTNLVESVRSVWASERKNVPAPWLRRIKGAFRRLPLAEGREVFCMDPTSKRPCQNADPRTATFVWLQKPRLVRDDEWQVLPAIGAEWRECPNGPKKVIPPFQIEPTVLRAAGELSDTTRGSLPGFYLQMVSRKTLGGAADQEVPIPAGSMSPSGFRLGPRREFRVATSGSRLLILLDEPATQIRYDDLFGQGASRVPEGEFTLTFGFPEDGDLLAADLSAAADGYTPKPLVEKWKAAVRISSRSSDSYTITAPGTSPEVHLFGEIISVPESYNARPGNTAAPLVLIRRMGTPAGILLVPALASLVLLIGIFLLAGTSVESEVAWDLSMLAVLLLTFRFLLTSRLWMDSSSSPGDLHHWLLAGCYTIMFAPLLFLVGATTSRAISGRGFRRTGSSVFASRAVPQELTTFAIWLGIAVICSLGWLLVGTALTFSDILSNGASTLWDFVKQVVVILLATLIAVTGFGCTRSLFGMMRFGARGLTSSPLPRRGRQVAGSFRLIIICAVLGFLLALSRFLPFLLGWQESLPFGLKLDVFYLPLAVGVLAGICSGAPGSLSDGIRLLGVFLTVSIAFAVTGAMLSDLGLLWVGGMALLLVLPFEFRRLRSSVAVGLSLGIFVLFFVSPKIFPRSFLYVLQQESSSALEEAKVLYPDPLQVRRDRDHYRMMDAVAAEEVRLIPAQLAREVSVERFRVRYQSLKGAWREGLRSGNAYGSSWNGAGLLQARPVVGERAFREATRSDYVYQIYVRAEHGTAGLLSLLFIYLALLLVPLFAHNPNSLPGSSLAVWALGIGVGSALFMLGGTHGIFPFSGKWTLFMALGSRSDFCLAATLLIIGAGGQYDAK